MRPLYARLNYYFFLISTNQNENQSHIPKARMMRLMYHQCMSYIHQI